MSRELTKFSNQIDRQFDIEFTMARDFFDMLLGLFI